MTRGALRFVPATLVLCGLFGVACSTVLGFPDRVLDPGDGAVSDAGTDTSLPTDAPLVPDGAPPAAALSRGGIDFGLVACGSTPSDQTIAITNVGGTPLVWTATLSATPEFTINGPAGGTVAVGATSTLAISAAKIDALSGARDTSQAILTITTNDAQKLTTDLPVKLAAAGGTLSIVPLTASFGDLPVGVAATDVPIALKNTGNQTITVGLTQPADHLPGGQFSLTWTGAPAAVAIAPGATMPLLTAHFTPNKLGASADTAPLVVTGAMCGTNPKSVTLTGVGTASNAGVQPGSLDFGLVNCGTTAAAKTVTIKNSGGAAFNFNAALGTAYYNLSATSGTVAAGASSVLTVTPVAVPANSLVTPNLYGDTLTITTDAAGDNPHLVDLRQTAQGAILMQSSAAIDFGSIRVTTTATSPFTVTNTGNAPATVSYGLGNVAFGVTPQGQAVAGGSNYTATAAFNPTAPTTYAATATMSASTTALCAPLPPGIALAGKGALSASVTPSSVDFGLVACGATAAPQSVTLTNIGTASFTWSAALGTANYTISPPSGSLAAGGAAPITITPKPLPASSLTTPDLYSDSLTITTVPAFESPYVASIHQTAQGAILAFNPASIPFGTVIVGGTASLPFNVINTGNLAATVALSSSDAQFTTDPTSVIASSSSSTPANAKFTPATAAPQSANVSMATGATLCAPLPAALQLSGTGN